MGIEYLPTPEAFAAMNTAQTRKTFLLETLFKSGEVCFRFTEADRGVIGSVMPESTPLPLIAVDSLRCDYFCQRRELGVLNIGASGSVVVDGTEYKTQNKDCLYIGLGAKEITFASDDVSHPAVYYLLSYPAHHQYPTVLGKNRDVAAVHLGDIENSNKRTIYKYIHPEGIKSCQLVMGFTELESGCAWNTMPCHTHDRRSEVYFYFDMAEETRIIHLMGEPAETRHLVVKNRQAIISPSWSIHCGAGTGQYTFCWGMGGENQVFEDMDMVKMSELQ